MMMWWFLLPASLASSKHGIQFDQMRLKSKMVKAILTFDFFSSKDIKHGSVSNDGHLVETDLLLVAFFPIIPPIRNILKR